MNNQAKSMFLSGTWRQIKYIEDGVTILSDTDTFVSFDGNNFTVTESDGTILIRGTYTMDPARNPKAIDWTDTFGPDIGKTFLAIFTLHGNSFAFCAADEGMERPNDFTPVKGHTIRFFERL